MLNHISVKRAGYQHSDKIWGVRLTSLRGELCVKMCNTGDIVCQYYHISVHIFLNIGAIQIPVFPMV